MRVRVVVVVVVVVRRGGSCSWGCTKTHVLAYNVKYVGMHRRQAWLHRRLHLNHMDAALDSTVSQSGLLTVEATAGLGAASREVGPSWGSSHLALHTRQCSLRSA